MSHLSNRERALRNEVELAAPHVNRALNYVLEMQKALNRFGTGTAAALIPMVREALDRAESHLPKIDQPWGDIKSHIPEV